jgi:hypothetical protein
MRTAWEQHFDEQHRAAVELTASEAAALADALSFYLRRRFGPHQLELSAAALSLRSLTGVSDRLGTLATAGLGGRLVLSEHELRGLREALCLYVAERDTESYQPPEERDRLSVLRALSEPLGDLLAELPSIPAPPPLVLR